MNSTAIFNARRLIGLTTTEAGQLVHVTKRTWEKWESGESNMPIAKVELFISKLNGEKSNDRELVVITNEYGDVIDVVSTDNFLCIEDKFNGTHIIKSLAVFHKGGMPYIFRTELDNSFHSKIIDRVKKWSSLLD